MRTNKSAMRRAWFQVHKWIGLALAALVIPLSLSGSLLVWHEPLDRLLNPQRYATSGRALLAPDAYAQAARGALPPGERITTLTMPEHGGPVTVAATPARAPVRPGPSVRTLVYLDPPTARVLDVAGSASGAMRFIHVLHGNLQIPGIGRTIVGWIGVAMAISCLSGLWLWWPVTGGVRRGFRWRRHRDLDGRLHHLLGFWIALPLFVLSVTGVWIAFPGVFGGRSGGGNGSGGRGGPAAPLASPARPLAQVIAAARPLGRGGALRSVTWPTERQPDWTLAFGLSHHQPVGIKVADDTGLASAAPARDDHGLSRLMRRIHDGDGMGPVWQAIIFVGGIVPAILAVTGVILWWRARGRRGQARARRAAVRAI